MNIRNRNRMGNLKLGAVVLVTGLLSACAYDPVFDENSNRSKENSREGSEDENPDANTKNNDKNGLRPDENASSEFNEDVGKTTAPLPDENVADETHDISVKLNRVEVLADSLPERYSVVFDFDKPLPENYSLVREKLDGSEILQIATIQKNELSFTDSSVSHNTVYVYKFLSQKGSSTFEIQVQIPRDFVISGIMTLQKIPENIHRLFLLNRSKILSNGSNFKIHVHQLIVDNSVIDSTPTPSKASSQQTGLSGGSINIVANYASGDLHIVARGQDGGDGVRGARGATGAAGAKGRNAELGWESQCFSHGISEGSGCRNIRMCKIETGNGGTGAQGESGGRGTSGNPGGDSAKIFLKIEDANLFRVTYDSIAGAGGTGGPGGLGGLGGAGGPAGNRDTFRICRAATNGPRGASGSHGPTGYRGPDGQLMPVCLVLGSAKIGDCRDFNQLTQ